MSQKANIKTLDIVQESKQALAQFSDELRMALTIARSDMQRTISRLQGEVADHWKQHLRQWNKKLAEAKTDLYRVQLQTGESRQKPIEQARLVERAQRNVDEAQWKLSRIKHWVRELDREMLNCKGQLQTLEQCLDADLPRAAARLDKIMDSLEAYVNVQAPAIDVPAESHTANAAPMARSTATPAATAFTLSADQRDSVADAAELKKVDFQTWRITDEDAATLDEIDLPIDPPFPEDRIIIATDALSSSTLRLHRAQGTSTGDSGWLITSSAAEKPPAAGDCSAISFADFIAACRGLERLALLPRGVTVRIDRGRIVDVLDADGRSRWQQPERA